MNIKELVEFHAGGAEACEACAITPDADAAKNKDIAKHYSKKAAWHREAVSALEVADASLAREAALREEHETEKLGLEYRLEVMTADRDALQQRLTDAEKRAAVMEKALSRIAREHDCGCSPCTRSCTSQVALEITVDAMRDIAIAALKPAEEVKS